MALAQQIGGVIVNADSAQVYRDLRVVSAAATADDLKRADHRLYGVQDGALPCSAADWAAQARREIETVQGEGRTPILVGGTGLYLRTLIEGIAPVPSIDPKIRETVRDRPIAENRAELAKLDADAAARLNPADTARIARALEVVMSTGRPIAEWQRERVGGISGAVNLHPLILLPPRDWLYARCDMRFEHMIDHGAVEEVKALLARNLNPSLPVMRGIGVPEISAYLRGESTLADAIAAGQQATRRYAKRQYTWFAHQPPAGWPRFTGPLEEENLAAALALLQPNR